MKKWCFSPNNDSIITGINDAGIETFKADAIKSLVRETIQNSLDACLNEEKPTRVEFNIFQMNIEKFPEYEKFKRYLNDCKSSNEKEDDAVKFFNNAIQKFNNQLKIIRISDFNTKGLDGSDTCEKGTTWSKLIKETGSSNKNKNSGGSFGIGKQAPFVCSDIRTVFYSTKDRNGFESYIGVAKLISFKNEEYKSESNTNSWTTGIGFYSESDGKKAIKGKITFDENFQRNEPGTDIYVIGFKETEDITNDIIFAVVENFIVSIWKNKLEVTIGETTISKNTLKNILDKINNNGSSKEKGSIDNLNNYYKCLTTTGKNIKEIKLNPQEYGEKYNFKDNECTFYIMSGENLNKHIMMTRKPGMNLFEKKLSISSLDFTGILVINGSEMNKKFRNIEVPTHTSWEPGRCDTEKEQKEAKKMYNGLLKYLKDKIIDSFGKTNEETIDAFGISEFLPDIDNNVDDPNKRKQNQLPEEFEIKAVKEIKIKPNNEVKLDMDIYPSDEDTELADESGESGNNNTNNGNGGSQGDLGTNGTNGTDGINHKIDKNNDLKGYTEEHIKYTLIPRNVDTGSYTLKYMIPKDSKKVIFKLFISGEQSDYILPIKKNSVNIKNSKCIIEKVQNNEIIFSNVSKGEKIIINFDVDFYDFCSMVVKYYEIEK